LTLSALVWNKEVFFSGGSISETCAQWRAALLGATFPALHPNASRAAEIEPTSVVAFRAILAELSDLSVDPRWYLTSAFLWFCSCIG
jgi:hypothetical protein